MGTKTLLFTATLILLLSTLYQLILKDLIFITLGVGRPHQKISEFPYKCHRLHSPLLESCEDMVIDEEGRTLYAACSSVASRREWSPGGDKYNVSGRDGKDHISVLSLDHPGTDGLYNLHTLTITGNYQSSTFNKEIDVHGLDIEHISPTCLRFWLINHRPPISPDGKPLDPKKFGANSTIEVFEHEKGSGELEWVRTIFDEKVATPNNLVAMGDGGMLVTNDHSSKTGKFRRPEMILGGGSIAYCSLSSPNCTLSLTQNLHFANGITLLKPPSPHSPPEALIAHSASALLTLHTFHPSNQTLSPVTADRTIHLKMPMDNLSIDKKGDVYIAAFPKVLSLIEAMDGEKRPKGEWVEIPSTVFRLRRIAEDGEGDGLEEKGEGGNGEEGWIVEKVVEDIEGMVLPGSTVAVHDVATGGLWMGGVASPFLAVCLPI